METIYLKASDMPSLIDALFACGLAVEDPELGEIVVVETSTSHALVILGCLSKKTGAVLTDDDGNEYDELLPVPGCHANLLAGDHVIISALDPLRVYPQTPLVKWAGIE